MLRFSKIIFAAIFCCQVIFISCKTRSKPSNNTRISIVDPDDPILNKFRHFFNDSFPQPKSYVNDYTYLFTAAQADSLNLLINAFEKRTTDQIVVVSFDTVMVNEQNFDSLTFKLFNAWGVGQKEKNNGILIGICAGYRKMRIQNGKGIEKILSNSATKQIIDSNFIPFFKQGAYFKGTWNGINAIIQKLDQLQQ